MAKVEQQALVQQFILHPAVEDSTKPFCVGLPGAMKCQLTGSLFHADPHARTTEIRARLSDDPLKRVEQDGGPTKPGNEISGLISVVVEWKRQDPFTWVVEISKRISRSISVGRSAVGCERRSASALGCIVQRLPPTPI